MASLEDHLRGNRRENLIGDSDSEDENGGVESDGAAAANIVSPPVLDGMPKTGPKGVLTDYYLQMMGQEKLSMLKDQERKQMIMDHSATVQSYASEQAEKTAEATARVNVARALEEGSLDQDQFMQNYRATRMAELKKQASMGSDRKRFGNLMEIRGDNYATVIDNCPATVTLIIHIYNELYEDCVRMNRTLTKLARAYPTAKLCRVQSGSLGLSQMFSESGLPTLMVYRDGDIIGNFPRIVDDLGKVYEMDDLEHFLREKGCLPPECEKETDDFMGSSSGAMKLLGVRKHSDSDDD